VRHTPKRLVCRLAFAGLFAAGAACDGRGTEPELLAPAAASAAVSEMLYEKNLISDPLVGAKLNEYVLRVSRDGVPTDSVMPQFHRWLASWAAEHPDRVAAAWVASSPYRAEHVDTASD
jgi:hypothetical protein